MMYNYNNPDLKVLSIHHADMDGCASYIVLKNFYNNIIPVPVTYQSEERAVQEALIKYKDRFDVIICTDFYPTNTIAELRNIAPVLVLDHHETVEHLNNNEDILINTSMCGAMMTYYFIKRFKDISYLMDFINIVNDWDMFILKDIKSKFFNNIYWEMGHKWFARRFINGNIKLYPEEQKYLIDAKQEFKDLYENLEISDLSNNGVFFETDRFFNECIEELKKDGYKWFAIKNKNALSIRADEIDLTQVFKIMELGGGHLHAGGIPLKYKDDVGLILNRLQLAVEAVYNDD